MVGGGRGFRGGIIIVLPELVTIFRTPALGLFEFSSATDFGIIFFGKGRGLGGGGGFAS